MPSALKDLALHFFPSMIGKLTTKETNFWMVTIGFHQRNKLIPVVNALSIHLNMCMNVPMLTNIIWMACAQLFNDCNSLSELEMKL